MSNSSDDQEAVSSSRAQCRPLIVAVVGNIGSGKSTFLSYCKDIENIKTINEPINEWTGGGGENLLVIL